MNKKEIAQAEAVKTLKEWGVVDGTTIYTKVARVSASGMNRKVQLFIALRKKEGGAEIIDISYWSAKALEWGYKDGYNGGINVGGCGMDMLFHTVYSLSYAMGYGDMCQDRDRTEPIEKKGRNGEIIKAIGLKYKQI